MEQVLTVQEFATQLKIGRKKAYEMVRSGEVRAKKIGDLWRIKQSDVDALLSDEQVSSKRAPRKRQAQ